MSTADPIAPTSPPRPNRLWLAYLAGVLALTLLATAALWWFNLAIQLTPQEFARQRDRWQRLRPADYTLTYFRVDNDETRGKMYEVTVEGGKVVRAKEFDVNVRERREIDPPGPGRPVPEGRAQEHSMDALFQTAADILAQDGERRIYVRGRFHGDNGALLDFVHRVMGERRRVQISVLSFRTPQDALRR